MTTTTAPTPPLSDQQGAIACSAEASAGPQHRTIIQPPSRWVTLNLPELWRYRELLFQLVWREVSANYRQSVIGYGWAIFKALTSVGIFTLIFGKLANLGPEGIPYFIWNYPGYIVWLYFSGSLTATTGSVVGGAGLLTKVYFPRLILPLSAIVKGLIDFGIQFILLILIMLVFADQISPGWGLALVPVFLILCALAALSVGLWLTALNVKYRDVGHMVGFLVQLWMWLSPVVYPSSKVPAQWRMWYGLNPMVGVIEGFRWATLGLQPPDWEMMSLSIGATFLLFIGGLYYFRKTEASFADVI